MKLAHVKVVGLAPLLMNRRPLEEESEDKVKKKTDTFDPKVDAERKSHFDETLGYYVPSDVIEGCLREAGKNLKSGRSSLKKTVQSSIFCKQEMVPLGRKDYDQIDKRYGTHPSTGNSVLVARVRFNTWSLEFDLEYDETRVKDSTVKNLLEEAGAVIAMGSYRPKFGRFHLESFQVQ